MLPGAYSKFSPMRALASSSLDGSRREISCFVACLFVCDSEAANIYLGRVGTYLTQVATTEQVVAIDPVPYKSMVKCYPPPLSSVK